MQESGPIHWKLTFFNLRHQLVYKTFKETVCQNVLKNIVRMDRVTALFYVEKLKERRTVKVGVLKDLTNAAKDYLNNKKALGKNIKKFSAHPKAAESIREVFDKFGEIKVQLDAKREQVEAEIKSIDSTTAAVVKLEKEFRNASDELARLKTKERDLQNRLFELTSGEGSHQKQKAKIYSKLEEINMKLMRCGSLVKSSVNELKKLVAVMDDMVYGHSRMEEDDSCSVSVSNCASNRTVLQETSEVVKAGSVEKVDRAIECDRVGAHKQSSEFSSVESQTAYYTEMAENQISPISHE